MDTPAYISAWIYAYVPICSFMCRCSDLQRVVKIFLDKPIKMLTSCRCN